ncbi:hypothetical protein F652_2368 [Enterobacteriaceae bacterium bta3-1]|nr:hypothetical protein F652_2368 [Enterobacteriaceae bacterium bta3-1]
MDFSFYSLAFAPPTPQERLSLGEQLKPTASLLAVILSSGSAR